jgi:hypothetical protein
MRRAKLLSRQLPTTCRSPVWIPLNKASGLGLYMVGTSFKGDCALFGSRQRLANGILQLLKGYSAVVNPRILHLETKPKGTLITGLLFKDKRHFEFVLQKLMERYFPPLIGNKI